MMRKLVVFMAAFMLLASSAHAVVLQLGGDVEILHKGMRGKSGKVTITVPMAGTHSEGNGTTFTLPEGVTVAETIHYFIEAANGAAIAPGTGAIMTDGTSPAIAGP